MNYKAILFDMDGVLVNSEPLHVAAFQSVLKGRGYDLGDDQYKQYFAGKTDEEGFDAYFRSVGASVDLPKIMDEKAQAYLDLASGRLEPYPGVIGCIEWLAGQKISLALVTGSLRPEAQMVLSVLGIAGLFSTVVAAEDITRGKPDPEGYLKGAQALHTRPEECLVVEDAPSGVKAAKAAGIHCIAVTNTHSAEELSGATLIVGRLSKAVFTEV